MVVFRCSHWNRNHPLGTPVAGDLIFKTDYIYLNCALFQTGSQEQGGELCTFCLVCLYTHSSQFWLLSTVHKTEQEIQETLARKEEKLELKAERRRKQEADLERKKEQRAAHRWGGGG